MPHFAPGKKFRAGFCEAKMLHCHVTSPETCPDRRNLVETIDFNEPQIE